MLTVEDAKFLAACGVKVDADIALELSIELQSPRYGWRETKLIVDAHCARLADKSPEAAN